jgi:hypothetical protein
MPSSVVESSGNAIVCPYVAQVAFDAQLNVTSDTRETVVINNIDHIFDISYNTGDLANCFSCTGWGVNKTDLQAQELIGSLTVDLSGSGAPLAALIATAVGSSDPVNVDLSGSGEHDAAGINLNKYLRSEYAAAFALAFPSVVPKEGEDSHAENTSEAQPGTKGTGQVDPGKGSNDNAASGAAGAGASVVTQTAEVLSYNFELDICGASAATAMTTGLSGNTRQLNSLFMQLNFLNRIAAHTDASGNPLDARLPLHGGDSITFVFDVTINASTDPSTSSADQNTGGPSAPNATQAPSTNGATPPTTQTISMDLGTRRVAFVLYQSSGAGSISDSAAVPVNQSTIAQA